MFNNEYVTENVFVICLIYSLTGKKMSLILELNSINIEIYESIKY